MANGGWQPGLEVRICDGKLVFKSGDELWFVSIKDGGLALEKGNFPPFCREEVATLEKVKRILEKK